MHGFVDDFRDYRWSSYKRILDPKITKLKKEEVLGWFGGEREYTLYHQGLRAEIDIKQKNIFIEDE